jgi:Protein of unknown function (DUF2510)
MEDSPVPNEPEPAPDPSAPDPAVAEAEQSSSPSPGWYPDPNAGGANLMRYWDGAAWTEQVQRGTEVGTTRRTDDERKVILAQQLQTAAARGLRIESQSDFQAVLVEGKPVNHVLHAILTIFTCLLWGIVWAILAGTGGEKRQMVVVDEFGNVLWQKLGSA